MYMTGKLRTARTLSYHDWWLLFQAWIMLLIADVGLRYLSLKRVQELMARPSTRAGAPDSPGAVAITANLERLVDISARHHVYAMSCLPRALALQGLLGQHGVATDLRIGVRKEAGRLGAHAWLEHASEPVGEAGAIAHLYRPLAPAAPGGEAPRPPA